MKKLIFKFLVLALSLNLFFPTFSIASATPNNTKPNIQGEAALAMDMDTGEIIYSLNADERLYPASTTKLMTGLLLAENKAKGDMLTYTSDAKQQPAYSLNTSYRPISVGEKLSAEDILSALLVYSANDSAYVIADNVAENYKAFADLMNKRAKELGMEDTNFTNPNGLHDDNHYSTAYDLALLGIAAYNNEWVRETLAQKESPIDIIDTRIILHNTNKNLGLNGNIGGKTGFTDEAERCLVNIFERNGRKIVGVVLKSPKTPEDTAVFEDMNNIIDYSYTLEKAPFKKSGEELGGVTLSYKLFKFFGPEVTINVPFNAAEDILYYDNDINSGTAKIEYTDEVKDAWNLIGGKEVELTFSTRHYTEKVKGSVDISLSKIINTNLSFYILTISILLMILILIIILFNLKKRKKLRKKKDNSRVHVRY